MLDKWAIEEKLTLMVDYLAELRQIGACSYPEFRGDFRIKRTTERLIQLVVECATDINGLLVTGLGHTPPPDYYSSFVELGRLGVLSPDFADELAPTTAIRNRLVHEYDTVDERLIYASVQPIIQEFSRYVQLINSYLQGRT
ncbi:MAG: DUF86 domain-containing protein [Chloroflexi bacterium]|nr:DUF86 domain-containing protein [Chloroflexota bacterium]MBU1748102.1 DUF86 domain-containing protein [Chloroflexota bacterium]